MVAGRRPEPFFFGIPLIARAVAGDWQRVEHLFSLTLRSLLAQTDGRFTAILAGHDRPRCWDALVGDDPRFRVRRAQWAPETPSLRNDDSGMKKWHIGDAVRRTGGGLLMYLDADDLVDRRTVACARARIGPEAVGGVLGRGVVVDFLSSRAVTLPDPHVFEGELYEICGSTTVARVEPRSPDPLRRDPHEVLGSHTAGRTGRANSG
jgi:hypothetical protein